MITDPQIGLRDPQIVTIQIRPAPHFVVCLDWFFRLALTTTTCNNNYNGLNAVCVQARVRLVKRKEELEELLQDLEQRLDDGEAQIASAAAEKKKLLQNLQDLEEQYVLTWCRFLTYPKQTCLQSPDFHRLTLVFPSLL